MKAPIQILFVLAFIIQACSSSRETRRGELSDAMEEASEENKGDRKVQTEPRREPRAQPTAEPIPVKSDTSHQPIDSSAVASEIQLDPSEEESAPTWLGVRFGGGSLKAADFEELWELGIAVGGYVDDRVYIEVPGFIGGSPLSKTSKLNTSIKDGVNFIGFGGEVKYFFTPSHTLLGPFILGGLNFTWMFWEYQNGIVANTYDNFGNVTGTETIYTDDLSGLDLFAGAGLHLMQLSGFHLGGELTTGVMLWTSTTGEGFDNDVFDSFYYLKLRLLINFGI